VSGEVAAVRTRSVPWHSVAFGTVFLGYLLLTLGVLYRSPVLTLDKFIYDMHWRHAIPESYHSWISLYVMLGQRGPATLVFLPWFIWVAKRDRSPRPLVLLGTSLVLLNVSVGIVKYAIRRVGPLSTSNTHDLFASGGTIYPSGHVSNAVVLYGLVAWIAVKYRKTLIALAVFLSVTVGLGTVYKNTHWFSDVVGGWFAGGLVLLALPWVMPTVERWTETVLARLAARRAVRRAALGYRDKTAAPPRTQGKVTPVSSSASAQSAAETPASLDALDESTRRGNPRISPIPSGP
jgi:membrane-associated phospholipid phosphatase